MAFVTQEIKVNLTNEGKKILATQGLANLKIYYTFFDDEVIYTLNAYPNLIPEISGDSDNISDKITFKYNLILPDDVPLLTRAKWYHVLTTIVVEPLKTVLVYVIASLPVAAASIRTSQPVVAALGPLAMIPL